MFEALSIGATGMQAQQLSVETIANNLANANTVAFKKGRVGFSDLMVRESARVAQAGDDGPAARRLGVGVGIAALNRVFEQGELKRTDSHMDIAIRGDGFLEVLVADGASAFTRGGTLKVKDGVLTTSAGHQLKPAIAIPEGAKSIVIGQDGRVSVVMPNQSNAVEVGQLELVRFASTASLSSVGDNLYRANEVSGEPVAVRAGDESAGSLAQGFLEASNVKMVDEMVSLMLAQRAYEASVKVVQAADEMLGLVNNLRK